MNLSQIKKGVKIIGIACSSFNRVSEKEARVVGAIYRGNQLLEGIISTNVTVDGTDATTKISQMILDSEHYKQIKYIMTRGATIAGFNYINLKELVFRTKLPVISIVDHQPNMEKITAALENLEDGDNRLRVLEDNGTPISILSNPEMSPIFVQFRGIDKEEVRNLIIQSSLIGKIPEPLRVARLIAISLF